MKKIIVFILGGILLVGIGFGIAKLIQSGPGVQEHEYNLAIVVSAPGDFSIAVTPANARGEAEARVVKGEPAIFTLTPTGSGGYDGRIMYDLAGMPEGSVSFSKNPASVTDVVTLTIATIDLMSNSTYVTTLTARAY